MNARQLGGVVIAVLVALGVYFAWPKEKRSPEDEIRALVAAMVASAEKRDAAGVTSGLTETFSGAGLKKQDLKQLLLGQFFGARQIVVLNPLLEVTVRSPAAGRFTGTFLFGRDGALPEASRYTIDAEVVKTSDGWQIDSANWSH